MMCTETAETAQRAKQSIESWLASSFATSGRWRPVVLLKDEMKLRGNLVATKKRTRATMKTDTVPPLSGPEFPCLHLCDANRETCNSGGKGNIEERGKLSLVNPSIDNSDLLVSDESPDTSGCSTGTTTSPIPRVQTQSISVVDLTNDTDADSDRYGLWKVGGSCTHTHMWPWIFFLGKRTVDEYPVAMRRSLCFFNVQLLLPLGSRLCAASRHKPEQPPSVGDGVSPMQRRRHIPFFCQAVTLGQRTRTCTHNGVLDVIVRQRRKACCKHQIATEQMDSCPRDCRKCNSMQKRTRVHARLNGDVEA